MTKVIFADKEMLERAKEFLNNKELYYKFCTLYTDQFFKYIGKSEWLHSDRWSAVYDWLRKHLKEEEIPDGMETCLVEYMETYCLHLKTEEANE